mmetsp:Transcript_60552/g.167816  ORF Transcript_60552/g.167816 Transcript_60552/m.167816 type:complete len:215 (-) Transcript_60552:1560-2204(-)
MCTPTAFACMCKTKPGLVHWWKKESNKPFGLRREPRQAMLNHKVPTENLSSIRIRVSGWEHTSYWLVQLPQTLHNDICIHDTKHQLRNLGHLASPHELCACNCHGVPVDSGHCPNIVVFSVVRDELHATDITFDNHSVKRIRCMTNKSEVFAEEARPEERYGRERSVPAKHVLCCHTPLLRCNVPMLDSHACPRLAGGIAADVACCKQRWHRLR